MPTIIMFIRNNKPQSVVEDISGECRCMDGYVGVVFALKPGGQMQRGSCRTPGHGWNEREGDGDLHPAFRNIATPPYGTHTGGP